jgi:NADH:ubiquinone oxidoreductase subunit E
MSEIEILNMRNTPCVPSQIVRIDRKSKWGNPFKMRSERERMHVIKKYTYYLLDSKLLDDLHELRKENGWLVGAILNPAMGMS